MPENFDKRIAELETLIADQDREMAAAADQFMDAATPVVAGLFLSEARKQVEKSPELVAALGRDKLAAMKADVTTLQADAAAIVRRHLDRDDVWWHRSRAQNWNLFEYPRDKIRQLNVPDAIGHALRWAAGEVGRVLETYGFVRPSPGRHHPWRRTDGDYHLAMRDDRPYYPTAVPTGGAMHDALRRYLGPYQEAARLDGQLAATKEQKEKTNALAVWDSV